MYVQTKTKVKMTQQTTITSTKQKLPSICGLKFPLSLENAADFSGNFLQHTKWAASTASRPHQSCGLCSSLKTILSPGNNVGFPYCQQSYGRFRRFLCDIKFSQIEGNMVENLVTTMYSVIRQIFEQCIVYDVLSVPIYDIAKNGPGLWRKICQK